MEGAVFHAVGSWRVLKKVGEGGMGEVYLAEQHGTSGFSRYVGLKTIRRDRIEGPELRPMFIDEARLVARLDHVNIQKVHNLIDWDGSLAMVMEWVHGLTLEELNVRLDTRNAYLPPALAIYIVSRVARALAYAHAVVVDGRPLRLVHCDVSPVNIFVSWGGIVKLGDFGIASVCSAARGPLGAPDAVLGKPPYLSPEQARGEPVDARSDLFTLGLVLFELLTGEQVFPAQTIDETLDLHRRWDVQSPRAWNPAIGLEVERVLSRLLAYDPEARYESAEALVQELDPLLIGRGAKAYDARLSDYLQALFPEVDRDDVVACAPDP